MTEPTRIDFLTSSVEIIEAFPYTRVKRKDGRGNRTLKQPQVTIKVKETLLEIKDSRVLWTLLDNISEYKFYWNAYLYVVEAFHLKVIIQDFLRESPNVLVKAWVEDGVIVGFSQSKSNIESENHAVMLEVGHYIKSKTNSYDCSIGLEENVTREGGKYMSLTANYISGNSIIEIVSRNYRGKGASPQVYLTCRYSVGMNYIQPIPYRTFKGELFALNVEDLYDTIDTFIDVLKVTDSQYHKQVERMEIHRLNLEDRNRLEFGMNN
jgi:hypothetical protein